MPKSKGKKRDFLRHFRPKITAPFVGRRHGRRGSLVRDIEHFDTPPGSVEAEQGTPILSTNEQNDLVFSPVDTKAKSIQTELEEAAAPQDVACAAATAEATGNDDDDGPIIASLPESPPRQGTESTSSSIDSDEICTTPRNHADETVPPAVHETPPSSSPAPFLVSAKRLGSEVRRNHSKRRKRSAEKENDRWNGMSDWRRASCSSTEEDDDDQDMEELRSATNAGEFWLACYGTGPPQTSVDSWSAQRAPPAKSCLSTKKKSPASVSVTTSIDTHKTPDRLATPPTAPLLKTPSPSPPDEPRVASHQKTVHFGATLTTAEYDGTRPPKELTPLPEKRLSQEFKPPTEQDEAMLAETKHNSSVLSEWDSYEDDDDEEEDEEGEEETSNQQEESYFESTMFPRRQPHRPRKARRQSGLFASPIENALLLSQDEEDVVTNLQSLAVDSPPSCKAAPAMQDDISPDCEDMLDWSLEQLLDSLVRQEELDMEWLEHILVTPYLANKFRKRLKTMIGVFGTAQDQKNEGPAISAEAALDEFEAEIPPWVAALSQRVNTTITDKVERRLRKIQKRVRGIPFLSEQVNFRKKLIAQLEQQVNEARNVLECVSAQVELDQRTEARDSLFKDLVLSKMMPFQLNDKSETLELTFSLSRIGGLVRIRFYGDSVAFDIESATGDPLDPVASEFVHGLLCEANGRTVRPEIQVFLNDQREFRFAALCLSQMMARLNYALSDLLSVTRSQDQDETTKEVTVERSTSQVLTVQVALTPNLRLVLEYDCTRDPVVFPIPSHVKAISAETVHPMTLEKMITFVERETRDSPSRISMSVVRELSDFLVGNESRINNEG